MTQIKVKIFLRGRLFSVSKAIYSTRREVQDFYEKLNNEKPFLNFGEILIRKDRIKYIRLK